MKKCKYVKVIKDRTWASIVNTNNNLFYYVKTEDGGTKHIKGSIDGVVYRVSGEIEFIEEFSIDLDPEMFKI